MKTFLRGATLLDGTGAEPFREAAVLIEGDHIAAVGRLSDFGSGVEEAREVDLTGKYLLPGFVNVHSTLRISACAGRAQTGCG